MNNIEAAGAAGKKKKKSFFGTLGRQWQLLVMSLPMLIYVLIFNYGPMWGWITAFQDYKPKLGITGSKFVGLKNFKWLFGRDDFLNSVRNTLAMSVVNLVLGTVAAMAQNIFASNGPINTLLMNIGLIKEPLFFLGESKYFWWLVGVINVWKEVGWNTIIYIAAMTSIDPGLYEAASIDGAGRFDKIRYITLPGIKSTFVILLIMNIGHLMEAGFEIQYLLGSSLVMDRSQTIDIFVLKYGISKQQYGVATAAGMFKSIVAIVLLFAANSIAKRLNESTLI